MSGDSAIRDSIAGFVRGGPVGQLLWRPWYDRVSLPLVTSLVFPLSRAWAAADAACAAEEESGRDPQDAFRRAVDAPDAPREDAPSRGTLALFGRGRRAYLDAEAALEDALFAGAAPDPEQLTDLADARDRRAVQFMGQRTLFGLQYLRERFPPVRFAIDPPDTVEAAAAGRLAAPDRAFAVPADAPRLRVSHPIAGTRVVRRYLRADGPAEASDTAPGPLRAVVLAPADRPPRAAVVIAHGICMEEDYWGGYSTLTHWLLDQGVAVLLPEGPWHGRRRPPGRHGGRFGGEVVVARGPAGLLGYFQQHVPELAPVIAWARAEWDRPVGLLGISLGALTGQLVLTAARHWAAEQRPDAALLVSPTDSVEATVFDGELTRRIGAAEALGRAGWTHDAIDRLRPLYQPPAGEPPALPPARILIALGDEDRVVPYDTGVGRADAWAIPAANRYTRNQGHFALSLGLPAAPEPLERLVGLLAAGAA